MLVGNDRFGARVQADSSRLMTSRANVPDDGSDQRSGEFIAPNPAKKRSSCVPLPWLENFPASLRRELRGGAVRSHWGDPPTSKWGFRGPPRNSLHAQQSGRRIGS